MGGSKKPFHPDQRFIKGNPDPNTPDWKQPLPRERFDKLNSKLKAVGLLTGTASGGIVAVDHDGSSCDPLIEKLSRQPLGDAMPKSVAFTSGRPGRYQILYQIPSEFLDWVDGKVILTGVHGTDGKPEQLDFRWDGCQSVIIGEHPETGSYRWVDGCSPSDMDVAIAPLWVVRQMLSFRNLNPSKRKEWTDEHWSLEYLSHIKNDDLEWHEWRNILFALHHSDVDESIARLWSSSSKIHDDKGFDDVWKHIKDDKSNPITVAYLGQVAKDNGWKGKPPKDHIYTPDNLDDLDLEVQEICNNSTAEFLLDTIFHHNLADPFTALARRLNLPAVIYAHNLLPVAASLLRIGIELEISSSTGHYAKPIVWAGVIAPSGAVKSPPFHQVTQPLIDYQTELYRQHADDLKEHEKSLEEWKSADESERGDKPNAPQERDLYFNDATIEAIAADVAKTPDRGAAILVDELGGLFTGLNQYKNGKGNDRQRLLSCYDGKSLKINRKTQKRVFLPQTSLSMSGTIQPEVLRRLMGNLDEVDGLWPRYLWVTIPLTKMPPPDDGPKLDISGRLLDLYRHLDAIQPQIFRLSKAAKAVWREWHDWTEDTKINEGHPALRAIYPKAREQAGRVALVLHCINSFFTNYLSDELSDETTSAAITYVKYCIGQAKLVYADFGVCDNPEAA
ncbi:MAG: DUF3987 domain-containing protein, partial [Thermosynechococcaceae cyanobacterium]